MQQGIYSTKGLFTQPGSIPVGATNNSAATPSDRLGHSSFIFRIGHILEVAAKEHRRLRAPLRLGGGLRAHHYVVGSQGVFRRCAAATIGQAALPKKPRAGALRSHFVTTAKQRRYASQR